MVWMTIIHRYEWRLHLIDSFTFFVLIFFFLNLWLKWFLLLCVAYSGVHKRAPHHLLDETTTIHMHIFICALYSFWYHIRFSHFSTNFLTRWVFLWEWYHEKYFMITKSHIYFDSSQFLIILKYQWPLIRNVIKQIINFLRILYVVYRMQYAMYVFYSKRCRTPNALYLLDLNFVWLFISFIAPSPFTREIISTETDVKFQKFILFSSTWKMCIMLCSRPAKIFSQPNYSLYASKVSSSTCIVI